MGTNGYALNLGGASERIDLTIDGFMANAKKAQQAMVTLSPPSTNRALVVGKLDIDKIRSIVATGHWIDICVGRDDDNIDEIVVDVEISRYGKWTGQCIIRASSLANLPSTIDKAIDEAVARVPYNMRAEDV